MLGPTFVRYITVRTASNFFKRRVAMAEIYDSATLVINEKKDSLELKFRLKVDDQKRESIYLERQKTEPLTETLRRIGLKIFAVSQPKSKKAEKKRKGADIVASQEVSEGIPVEILAANEQQLAVPPGCACIEALQTGNLLKANKQLWRIVVNPPRIEKLDISIDIITGCPVVAKMSVVRTTADSCRFLWLIADGQPQADGSMAAPWLHVDVDANTGDLRFDESVWSVVSRSQIMELDQTHSGKFLALACVPVLSTSNEVVQFGVGRFTKCSKAVQLAPEQFVFSERHRRTIPLTMPKQFRVISYNILADLYATSFEGPKHFFPYCDPEKLEISYRLPVLMKELRGYNGDILCLQEVDLKVFDRYLKDFFHSCQISSVYCGKDGEAPEGCVMAFNRNKFSLYGQFDISFSKMLESGDPEIEEVVRLTKQTPETFDMMASRKNIVQVTVLKCISEGVREQLLVVGNTHLYFDPKWAHVKLLQTVLCVKQILKVVRYLEAEKVANRSISVMFCGDLNSTRDTSVFEYLNDGVVQHDHNDWTFGSVVDQPFLGELLRHPLGLKCLNPNLTYSTFTENFRACIDHVFADSSIKLLKNYTALDVSLLSLHKGLPSALAPSDHLPVICDVSLSN